MTSRDGAPPIIYVPSLHRELATGIVPDSVLFMDPGLPQTADVSGLYRPTELPLSREKAARVLAELLALGEAIDATTAARTNPAAPPMPESEKADLARFAAQTPAKEVVSAAPPAGAPAVAAQKVLLLEWDLEEKLLDIKQLREEIFKASKPLAENIHGPAPEDPFLNIAETFTALHDSVDEEADWRLTVSAMATFLPQNAVLITAHPGMREALHEADMLRPLPRDLAARLTDWPDETTTFFWAKAPLWRVFGHPREPKNAPWLLAEPDIIIYPA